MAWGAASGQSRGLFGPSDRAPCKLIAKSCFVTLSITDRRILGAFEAELNTAL